IIFRNSPQWFVYMDRDIEGEGDSLRARALKAIDETRFVPKAGQNRLRGMIQGRPDWVLSRQRAWGVPIAVFVKEDGEILVDDAVNQRIIAAFKTEGADAWFADGARERFLGKDYASSDWEPVTDILDVWFDSGSTHAFVVEARDDLKVTRPADGGDDYVLYLEGSDQHRGWFHSSLLESCGTRGRAPFDAVLTHGFTMAEDGRKMSKSLNNQVFPQKIIEQYGADILRLWVMNTDYADDQRIGPEIVKSNADAYRRLRNTIRFMLGNLSDFDESERVPVEEMPELERWVLHRLSTLDAPVRDGYRDFGYQRLFTTLFNFCTLDLSAFYFDIRKDTLYCEPATSLERRACRTVLHEVFRCVVLWLAPMLCFTMEETWQSRFPDENDSVHLQQFPDSKILAAWRNDDLADKWREIRAARRVVTGALEIERADKRLGSSLEASPVMYVSDPALLAALEGLDMAELCITSGLEICPLKDAPEDAYRLSEASDKVAVVVHHADGQKCGRCWMVLEDVGSDASHPTICARCANVVANVAS
ncbi:MAG: class I tRNA ligase family protein, partial [Rhizobiales bacterium]|nr:class I tRNA ligase family protein [Hyphomicrobiales bacterium]